MAPWSSVEEGGERTPLLKNKRSDSKGWCWSPAFTVAVLGCLGIMVEYCQRVSLSIAIVTMTAANNTSHAQEEFSDWDTATQGLVLGSFFLGYAASNMAGGYASDYFGGKKIFGVGVAASSSFSILLPVCSTNANLFASVRLLQGLAQGVTFPAITAMLAKLTSPSERSRFTSIAYSGSQIGTVLGMVVTGWLCSSSFMGGWPAAFYVFGACGLMWALAWGCFVHESPTNAGEKLQQESIKIAQDADFPWRAVLKSLPFWALMAASVGSDFGFYTLLMELPKYLSGIRNLHLEENAFLSVMPYLLSWVFNLLWATLADFLTNKNKASVLFTRRLSMAMACFGPMLGLIAMFFVKYDVFLGMALLCVSVMLTGAANSGYLCSHQDLSPNWAGSLLGITNTVGALVGIASPAISGLISKFNGSIACREMVIVAAGIYFVSCILYLAFASADVQSWNEPTRPKGTSIALLESSSFSFSSFSYSLCASVSVSLSPCEAPPPSPSSLSISLPLPLPIPMDLVISISVALSVTLGRLSLGVSLSASSALCFCLSFSLSFSFSSYCVSVSSSFSLFHAMFLSISFSRPFTLYSSDEGSDVVLGMTEKDLLPR